MFNPVSHYLQHVHRKPNHICEPTGIMIVPTIYCPSLPPTLCPDGETCQPHPIIPSTCAIRLAFRVRHALTAGSWLPFAVACRNRNVVLWKWQLTGVFVMGLVARNLMAHSPQLEVAMRRNLVCAIRALYESRTSRREVLCQTEGLGAGVGMPRDGGKWKAHV